MSTELELLPPECGHGAACDELRQLTTDQQTTGVQSRFADHCWVELLDPFSMAQVRADSGRHPEMNMEERLGSFRYIDVCYSVTADVVFT